MRDAAPQTIHLVDYQPVPVTVTEVALDVTLDPKATRVIARLYCTRQAPGVMVLDGEDLDLVRIAINGTPLTPADYTLTATTLTIHDTPDAFELETEVEIAPASNTALEGLYMSGGMYCTQCEAEGFRKITYMLDRPDVMATYRVRIVGNEPVLLSNGNLVDEGPGWAEWHDPWPKPTYLFALVAGDLRATTDRFVTMEGREVTLNIWVRPGDENKTAYAMDALKRSMTWDEEVYGRAYDLDLFNIVAVDDFNMGAMENKGLNVFNSKYVLASAETATDRDFALIEGIIAHEYFHNWTGNRITCRDWFQLCLKEGLTVYRDQQFSGDARGHAVQRIEDVLQLRARQFREDAGPLAHNVRPESFVEINNFYTATVYEKGAELIGMLHRLVGPDLYRAGTDLYFERHDGQACTIEDWLAVFEEVANRDLSQFKRWYSQSGTPKLTVRQRFEDGVYTAEISQETPVTPNQTLKEAVMMPLAFGLLDPSGQEIRHTEVLEFADHSYTLRIEGLKERPVLSMLRHFSAPVILDIDQTDADRLTLLAHDTDPFNRWEAGRALAKSRIMALLAEGIAPDTAWLEAIAANLRDDHLDPAFRALTVALPSEDDIAQSCVDAGLSPDPDAIYRAREAVARAMAEHMADDLPALIDTTATPGPYSPDAGDAGKRSLRAALLRMTTRLDGGTAARAAYAAADNMTDQLSAFACLLGAGDPTIAAEFEAQWSHDRLVMDKWFMLQVSEAAPDQAVAVAQRLSQHADFDWKNPNRFRSLIAGLTSGNPAGFHQADGSGYAFLADWLIKLDALNPQTTARMSTAFETWRRFDADRQALIQAQMNRIRTTPNLSSDTTEMLDRMLNA